MHVFNVQESKLSFVVITRTSSAILPEQVDAKSKLMTSHGGWYDKNSDDNIVAS
jgi:hypothetical protein